jgi:hypothetical protein
MKLMKKNSSNTSSNNSTQESKLTKQINFKFNWEKIADGKSSARS